MCGISGVVGKLSQIDSALVEKMNLLQSHRGPDGAVIRKYSGAILGHSRLKVIDLSDQAKQPMESQNGHYSMVFNGEIYNYKSIRKELEVDYNFISNSDTEVLLAAFQKWGKSCLEHITGMFAFCIYDLRDNSAFFARDRFGQKPLFFYELGDKLIFSSEIKSLLAYGVKAEPDMCSWYRYLALSSYDDNSSTFFKGIKQLCPGEMANWSPDSGLYREVYYDISSNINPSNISFNEASEVVKNLLVDSCTQHMNSDVPVGVSLSGGLDSSALLSCFDLGGVLNRDIKCISVDFGKDLTEEDWINAAASHHGLKSNIINFSPNEFRDYIKPMMWYLEAPLGGLMNCALTKVMKTARDYGVVVMQDGSGLDEAFGGYRNHHNIYVAELFRSGDRQAEKALFEYANSYGISVDTARIMIKSSLNNGITSIDGTIPVRPDLLSPNFVHNNCLDSYKMNIESTGDTVLDAFVNYLQVSKIPRNMRMKDRTSMAFGVELRAPFLDHKLIEFALSLPMGHHFLKGQSKAVIRKSLDKSMNNIVRSATKRSIQAPQGLWMTKEPMKSYIESLIHSESFADRGIFDISRVTKSFDEFCMGKYDNSFFVWQWINIEEWFRMFIDANSTLSEEKFS